MEIHRLLTKTLKTAVWGPTVARLLATTLEAVEPAAAVKRYLRREGNLLIAGERVYDLTNYERVFVVGAGKAGAPMSRAAVAVLGENLTAGIVIVKSEEGSPVTAPLTPIALLGARHPIPDERGVVATRRIAELLKLEGPTEQDLVLALISGGASALLTLPPAGISLNDIQELTTAMLACGANIREINCLRKHLDLAKGGGLARMAAPATLISLILSDVVGNPLDVIASGPTYPDETTFADALAILDHYDLLAYTPAPLVTRLQAGQRGEIAETAKPQNPVFAKVQNVLVGSNQQAAAAALEAAQNAGFNAMILTTYAEGEARVIGRFLAATARELATTGFGGGQLPAKLPRPACLIVGGETTVTLHGDGVGGRNQEIALAAVRDLAGLENVALVTLATDGDDGPTDAAGAVVTGETLAQAQALGLNPDAFLAQNDSYPFFGLLGDLLKPGLTKTNVNDLAFIFAF